MKRSLLSIIKAVVLLLILNILASFFYARLDLTEDNRYTLSTAALNSVGDFSAPVIIDILLDGNLPPNL